jgi:tetratricopeptide (TPR) repeat protein
MVGKSVPEEHPEAVELAEFIRGKLDEPKARFVVKHLLLGCPGCGAMVEPEARLLLPGHALRPPSDGAEYEPPIDRAFKTAERHWQALQSGQRLAETDLALPEELPAPWVGREGEERCHALLKASWKLRYSDPAAMVALATLATAEAEQTAAGRLDDPALIDLLAKSWTELGNAHRVTNNLQDAELALRRAALCLAEGSGDPRLRARVLDRISSLLTDQRHFKEAGQLLDEVYAIHQKLGDPHMAGRALISKGTSHSYAEESEQGMRLIAAGLGLIEPRTDPSLVFSAIHTLIDLTVRQERFAEAQRLLHLSRRLYAEHAGSLNLLKRRWLEGKIAAGLGDLATAEGDLLAVREGFAMQRLPYTVAIASLDLATVYLRQGRTRETRRLVEETLATFRVLDIRREAIAALLVLNRALERERATLGLMRAVTARVRRVADGPTRRS